MTKINSHTYIKVKMYTYVFFFLCTSTWDGSSSSATIYFFTLTAKKGTHPLNEGEGKIRKKKKTFFFYCSLCLEYIHIRQSSWLGKKWWEVLTTPAKLYLCIFFPPLQDDVVNSARVVLVSLSIRIASFISGALQNT